jgi:hypothetical protein
MSTSLNLHHDQHPGGLCTTAGTDRHPISGKFAPETTAAMGRITHVVHHHQMHHLQARRAAGACRSRLQGKTFGRPTTFRVTTATLHENDHGHIDDIGISIRSGWGRSDHRELTGDCRYPSSRTP